MCAYARTTARHTTNLNIHIWNLVRMEFWMCSFVRSLIRSPARRRESEIWWMRYDRFNAISNVCEPIKNLPCTNTAIRRGREKEREREIGIKSIWNVFTLLCEYSCKTILASRTHTHVDRGVKAPYYNIHIINASAYTFAHIWFLSMQTLIHSHTHMPCGLTLQWLYYKLFKNIRLHLRLTSKHRSHTSCTNIYSK